MNHDPICLEPLSLEQQEIVSATIEPVYCDVCIAIAKARADERKKTAVIASCLINKLGGRIEISEKELMTSNGIITSTRDLSRQSLILEVIDE